MYVQLYKLDYIAALPLEAGISDAITIVLPVVTGVAALVVAGIKAGSCDSSNSYSSSTSRN